MFGLFKRKKEVEQLKEDTRKGFDYVKKDVSSLTGWIKHLESERKFQENEIEDVKKVLSSIKEEIEGIKNVLSFIGETKTNRAFKTPQQVFNKQTAVYGVQTGVQTAVQTPNLEDFSITEKAILWVLMNTDMKLSYDDLAAMLGKERSTIRGQINRIKQKNQALVQEQIEKNGKKRVYIPEDMREKLLKKQKVRVKNEKKSKKSKKSEKNKE
ncbi:MAG: hypothetical protein ACOCUU_00530 [Nanoarchaeota archaeon]